MTDEILDRMRAELARWRTRMDELRVQLDLGEKDARDELRALETRLQPAVDEARRCLAEVASKGAAEARTLAASLRAGWDEVLRTHRYLSEAARRETGESV